MKFDPNKKRKIAEEFELEWVLNTEFDAAMPMGNVMVSHLNSIISFILVGLGDSVRLELPKFKTWLKIAIDQREDFGDIRSFHNRKLNWALGIYTWIVDKENAKDLWEQVRILDLAALADGAYGQSGVRAGDLNDYMAFCLQSENYSEGILEFEKNQKVAAELSSDGVLEPQQFAYLVCLAHAAGEYDQSRIIEAGRRMLRANLEHWLGHGAYIEAATWLKVVNFDIGNECCPSVAILKAYDDMPHTVKPEIY